MGGAGFGQICVPAVFSQTVELVTMRPVGESIRAASRDPLLILLILAGLFFGLAPLLAPKQFGEITGFAAQG